MNEPRALRTIAVAMDFSDNARVALAWAKELARMHGADLLLAHATAPETLASPEFVPLPPEAHRALHAEAVARLESEAAAVRAEGLRAESEVVCAHPAPGVLDVAARHGADLIVAGTRGRTGWKRILLGSTAARLAREAPCPVLTVHPEDAGIPRTLRTVLVPTDFSEDASLAAEAAARLLGAPAEDRRLVLLHAYRVPIDADHQPTETLLEAIRAAEGLARESLDALATALEATGVKVETTAVRGYPPEMIVQEASRLGADLIAMGTRGRSGVGRLLIGSTAERVLPSAPCPVLTVRRA